jgi:dynein heavy chain
MHDNAEIVTAQNDASILLETVLGMQPRTSSGTGKSTEQVVTEILQIIEQNIPPPFDIESVKSKYPTLYEESMNTVLVQEVYRYNTLLLIMKKQIKNLKKALLGKIVMSDEMDRIATSLYNNQVPQIWIKVGFLSLKPLMGWIGDLKERIEFFDNWISNGTPKAFCLPSKNIFLNLGFSFPQAFLTGTLQNFARKHHVEIDLLSFEFKILDLLNPLNVRERPADGCYVYGMYLEGARWDYKTHKLDHSKNRELYTDVPLIQMVPVANRKTPETGIYICPLYKVLSRQGTLSTTGHSTNFVLFVELPSGLDESVWIKAGVAMFLALKQ